MNPTLLITLFSKRTRALNYGWLNFCFYLQLHVETACLSRPGGSPFTLQGNAGQIRRTTSSLAGGWTFCLVIWPEAPDRYFWWRAWVLSFLLMSVITPVLREASSHVLRWISTWGGYLWLYIHNSVGNCDFFWHSSPSLPHKENMIWGIISNTLPLACGRHCIQVLTSDTQKL